MLREESQESGWMDGWPDDIYIYIFLKGFFVLLLSTLCAFAIKSKTPNTIMDAQIFSLYLWQFFPLKEDGKNEGEEGKNSQSSVVHCRPKTKATNPVLQDTIE